MKRIALLLFVGGTLCQTGNGQFESKKARRSFECSTALIGLTIGTVKPGLTGMGSLHKKDSKFGFFFGFDKDSYVGNSGQEPRAPYKYLRESYISFYGGGVLFLKHIEVAAGLEYQNVTQVGDIEDVAKLCARFYVKTALLRSNLLFTCNAGGRQFFYSGYWCYPIHTGFAVGIYANNASTGIGPLVTFGVGKKTTGIYDSPRPFGISLGYNPQNKNAGVTILLLN